MKIDNLQKIHKQYNAILCDVWGVIHNGQKAHKRAVETLLKCRENGKIVVLITNAPRPAQSVIEQLEIIGVDQNAYDSIVTSGDVTKNKIEKYKNSVFHLGPERDNKIFEGIKVEFKNAENAECVVCTGLVDDDNEKPQDYKNMFQNMIERKCKMICANPDIVVERGDKIIWCAGALAQLYEEMGGEIEIAGKPHKPIYQKAMEKINEMTEKNVEEKNVLAIGDAIATDAKGAGQAKVPFLFITNGIHAKECGDDTQTQKFLEGVEHKPEFWQTQLNW